MIAATMMLADVAPGAAIATTTAQATPASAPAAATAAAAAKPKDKLICRSESVTGSLMPKKTCYLESERAQQKQEQRQNLEKVQNNLGLTTN
jgi:hypothetical protein